MQAEFSVRTSAFSYYLRLDGMMSKKEAENVNEKSHLGQEDELDDVSKNITDQGPVRIEPEQEQFFAEGLRILNQTGVPYLVGAAFARHAYTGVWRPTKDLDIFLKVEDLRQVLDAFEEEGYVVGIEYPHWLAKVYKEEDFIDLLFGFGHGQLSVDDSWFQNRLPTKLLGVSTWLMPLEELIASSMFIGERQRFDASDVVHLIRSRQGEVNWRRVLQLLGNNWGLLLWHLVLFDYVYPGHHSFLPKDLMIKLFDRIQEEWDDGEDNPNTFRGTVLDPFSFSVDIEDWGYEDRRVLEPIVDEEGNLV